jgi:hypothetical protein
MRRIRPSRRVAQGEDVEDLIQLLFQRTDVLSACAQHDLVAAARELKCVDLAALLERPAKRVDHLLAAVTDPLLAQPVPAHVSIEQPGRSFEITAPKGAEEIDHDRFEVHLADAWHHSSFASTHRAWPKSPSGDRVRALPRGDSVSCLRSRQIWSNERARAD